MSSPELSVRSSSTRSTFCGYAVRCRSVHRASAAWEATADSLLTRRQTGRNGKPRGYPRLTRPQRSSKNERGFIHLPKPAAAVQPAAVRPNTCSKRSAARRICLAPFQRAYRLQLRSPAIGVVISSARRLQSLPRGSSALTSPARADYIRAWQQKCRTSGLPQAIVLQTEVRETLPRKPGRKTRRISAPGWSVQD